MTAGSVRAHFLPEVGSVAAARRFVAGAVVGLHVDEDALALLTSEVASNAVRHARTAFDVVVTTRPEVVRVEVINDAPEMLVIRKEPSS